MECQVRDIYRLLLLQKCRTPVNSVHVHVFAISIFQHTIDALLLLALYSEAVQLLRSPAGVPALQHILTSNV
jgi:hypothetical protein